MTNYYTYVDETGLIVSNTETLLSDVQTEYQGVFTTGLNTDSSTPQGLLISAETTARAGVIAAMCAIANQINPNESEGTFLDALCALSGLERQQDQYTSVPATMTFAGAIVLAAGSIAATEAGDQFELSSSVTASSLDGSYVAYGTFTALEAGPVPCGTGTLGLTTVVTGALGWETVSNATTATIGTTQQDDEDLRALRRATLFIQGTGTVPATYSGLLQLVGPGNVQFIENSSSSTVTISGVTLNPKSVWFCVDNTAPNYSSAAVATQIVAKKSFGAGYNGAQSFTVVEPISGASYTPQWDIPTQIPCLIQITVRQGTYVGNLANDPITALLAFAANEVPGMQGQTLGQNVSPFDLASAVIAQCPGIQVKACLVTVASTINYQPTEIEIGISQKAVWTASSISVIIST